MQALSSIETSVEIQVREATHHTPTAPDAAARAAAEPNRRSAGSAAPKNTRLQLGDLVRHGRYGSGRVLAHWPDGTVQVRFNRTARNRLVWPAFLESLSG